MTEYKIKIKMYHGPILPSSEQLDEFSDRWIEKIEELRLTFGGGFNSQVGILGGVIDFGKKRANSVEKNLWEIQAWLGKQLSKPVILQLLLLTDQAMTCVFEHGLDD